MKKTGWLFFVIIITGSHLYAQSDDFQRVRLGVKIAPAIVWMKSNTKDINGNGSKIGFSYGLLLDYNFTKNYSIGTGLEVAYRGGSLKDQTAFTGERAAVYKLQYLQLPFTVKLKTNEIGYMTYFGQLGLETGFNIVSKGTDLNSDTLSTDKENIRSQITPFNLALLIQAGAELSLSGRTSFVLSAYFSNGFLDIIRTVNPNFDARSNGAGLSIGVFF